MIHLDTNVLIGLAEAETPIVRAIERWLDAGEALGVSSVAWFEFNCGPLDADAVELIDQVISGRVVAFNSAHAERAAQLFNSAGRQRATRWDCMIAGAAIESGARLATRNRADFSRFKSSGLDLVAI
jgi:predicted nucleic acid-binding protein